jgi:hypothetical protein
MVWHTVKKVIGLRQRRKQYILHQILEHFMLCRRAEDGEGSFPYSGGARKNVAGATFSKGLN